MSIEGPIQTNNSGLVFYFDSKEPKSYVGEPTTNIWSIQAGVSINNYNSWSVLNAGTANITSVVITDYGSWNGNRIWLVSVGSGTLATYGSWRLCVDQPTAGSAYSSTRRVAAKIRMLTGSITNIGLHSGGSTGAHNSSDFTSILEKNVPSDCAIKDGWVQMLSDASWSSTTVAHCVGIGLNNSGPYSFLVTDPMYYPSNRLVNFTPTSRSNTQGLLDLVGGSTIDLTNAGYNASSEITFNGSSSRLTSANAIFNRTSGQEITVACWVKPSRNAGQYQIIAENRSSDASLYNWILYQHTNDGAISFHGIAQNKSSYIPTLNQWIYVANAVTTAGVSTLYINGVSTHVTTGYTYGNSSTPSFLSIGGNGNGTECFQGNVDTVAVYSRALSAAEILKNFNSQRSRYNV